MSKKPFLTIGMATFDDYHGVYFSIQALRMYHREIMNETEILIIDQGTAQFFLNLANYDILFQVKRII